MSLNIPFAISILKWLIKAPVLYAAKLFVVIFAPIIALPVFVVHEEESEVTGFPSLYPGQPREFLVKWLRWAQTHDAPVDEYGVANYHKRDKSYLHTLAKKLGLQKYYYRVRWLWRNNSYGLAQTLGYKNNKITILKYRDQGTWRTPITDYQYWLVRNQHGQIGWQLQGQIIYSKTRKIEYRFGYGLFRASPLAGKGLLYARILPFRKY